MNGLPNSLCFSGGFWLNPLGAQTLSMYPPPPVQATPLSKYSRRRDCNNCVRNLITYEM